MFVQDLRYGVAPATNFHPLDMQSPAVFAAFQDEEDAGNSSYILFVVGFQDGTLSLFKLSTRSRRLSCVDPSAPLLLQPSLVASILKLHKAAMGGLSAASFLPGHKSRIVSVGNDGRCRLVDFEGGRGKILRT
jgi:WD40 repeat protein